MSTTKTKTTMAKDTAEAAAETIETLASVSQETLKTAMNMGAEAAAEGYKNAAALGKEQMDMTKTSYDKLMTYGKDNLEAVSAASSAAVAGAEAYYEQVMAFSKQSTTESMDIMQKIFSAKTPQELIDLQIEAVNKSLNQAIAQTTKLNKIATDTAVKTFEPVKSRVDGTVESFVKPFLNA